METTLTSLIKLYVGDMTPVMESHDRVSIGLVLPHVSPSV